jgi:HSP20 family protein
MATLRGVSGKEVTMALPDLLSTHRGVLSSFFRDLDDYLETNGKIAYPKLTNESIQAALDISEDRKNYLLSVDLPGVQKTELKIEQGDGIVTISAKQYGKHLKQSFSLPAGTNGDEIHAYFKDGVLDLTIPKSQNTQKRPVELQPEKAGKARH